ncbi:DUF5137 domain-containing protein [Kluyveromyces lactis]|uniref:KLLA0F03179p n=1 Tax=Kluyveromyces lactis (strain ATCC 8585 / CBS 2359 / DSM 70799 / NBRC 1267 / NRRL Y-1140 / WM37) TaxID=284590 RepID=B5FV96_KLULA|nr:uncharacterized protein KLLA0_F03179g [Kluyveromyces lactis]CAR64391.1 KLLA0F03179p [Kluyveromyces lactis]|eukprot:XP_002999425.1 uncharacterized protein KLLA0_F03179g [Kluyveromyces lactis]
MDENDPYGWYLEEPDNSDWETDDTQQIINSEMYTRSLQPEKLPALPPIKEITDDNLKRDRSERSDSKMVTNTTYSNSNSDPPNELHGIKRQRK